MALRATTTSSAEDRKPTFEAITGNSRVGGTLSAAADLSGGVILQLKHRRILATSLLSITWVATVALGLRVLFNYENTPGTVGASPQAWPTAQIERATDRPTLVMVAHPHCPCTKASVGELAKIMA